jgi:uracil-DNA glycosylase
MEGTRKVTGAELRFGFDCLKSLFELLPHVKIAVLVGRKAQRAAKLPNGVPVLSSFHPSPRAYHFSRE